MRLTKLSILIFTGLFSLSQLYAQKIETIWEVTSLEAPESVVFYPEKNVFFVSNVAGQPAEKNGLGYITKIDEKGTVITQKWATGFNAPKGLAIYENDLYVADIDLVKVVDLTNGNIKKTYAAQGATFLNDVEIDNDGTVYISDTFGGNAVYRIKNGEITLWLKSDKLNYPNGLKIRDNKLYVASWGVVTNPETFGTEIPGKLLAIDLSNKEIKALTSPTGNLDGLVNYQKQFLATDWISGKLFSISTKGKTKEIRNLTPGSADIYLMEKENLLLIPQMLDGKLIAYKIK